MTQVVLKASEAKSAELEERASEEQLRVSVMEVDVANCKELLDKALADLDIKNEVSGHVLSLTRPSFLASPHLSPRLTFHLPPFLVSPCITPPLPISSHPFSSLPPPSPPLLHSHPSPPSPPPISPPPIGEGNARRAGLGSGHRVREAA